LQASYEISDPQLALQNIVKEGLTSKLFQNKHLASPGDLSPESLAPSRNSESRVKEQGRKPGVR